MNVNRLFGEDTNNGPLYTIGKQLPDSLDYPLEYINQMDDKELEDYSEKLRVHFLKLYEENNFPIGTKGKTFDAIVEFLRKFNDYSVFDILNKGDDGKVDVLVSFNKWFTAINHWFPEMYDTVISSSRQSIIGQLRNKDTFLKNLIGIVKKDQFSFRKNDKFGKISNYIASGFRVINGNQPAVNFPAGVAKWIYIDYLTDAKFKKQKNIYVLDQSMGWGGRFIGLLSAASHNKLKNKIIHYIGTDVNTATHKRFNMILSFWKEYINPDVNVILHKVILPAEDILNDPYINSLSGKVDMSLTSPPYFNREQYSLDETQSYRRYQDYGKWKKGFLYKTIRNTKTLLKPDGRMYWNIADIKVSSSKDYDKAYLPLENDSIHISEHLGMNFINTYKMLMSSMVGISRVDGQKVLGKNRVSYSGRIYKYEPIFVFEKNS